MHEELVEAVKSAQRFFENCQKNTKDGKPTWIASDTFIKGFPEILQKIKQVEDK